MVWCVNEKFDIFKLIPVMCRGGSNQETTRVAANFIRPFQWKYVKMEWFLFAVFCNPIHLGQYLNQVSWRHPFLLGSIDNQLYLISEWLWHHLYCWSVNLKTFVNAEHRTMAGISLTLTQVIISKPSTCVQNMVRVESCWPSN